MYHAIVAKDYKALQKLPGFGVRLLPHMDRRKASLCGQAAAGLLQSRYLQVKMGSEVRWMGYISESSPEVQMGGARSAKGTLSSAAAQVGSEAIGAGGSVFPCSAGQG